MSEDKLTLAKEYQNLLYGLLQEKVMSLDGPTLPDEQGHPVTYISREELVDQLINVLNEFGKAMDSDGRLNQCG